MTHSRGNSLRRAQTEGLHLTSEGGAAAAADKRLLESALEGEITDHLGYETRSDRQDNGSNSHNGKRGKTVLTDVVPVENAVPRDRDGTFEPKIVKKRQKRGFAGSCCDRDELGRLARAVPGQGVWRPIEQIAQQLLCALTSLRV